MFPMEKSVLLCCNMPFDSPLCVNQNFAHHELSEYFEINNLRKAVHGFLFTGVMFLVGTVYSFEGKVFSPTLGFPLAQAR